MYLTMEQYFASDVLAKYLIRKGGIFMYVNPFLAGILFTILAEVVSAVLWSFWKGGKLL